MTYSINIYYFRDKNHPSVIAWSIANEPVSNTPDAAPYFQEVADYSRSLDRTRPVMAVLSRGLDEDQSPPALDIIGLNRYDSWYSDTGMLEVITKQLSNELMGWKEKYPDKPLMITEYGGDTISGIYRVLHIFRPGM